MYAHVTNIIEIVKAMYEIIKILDVVVYELKPRIISGIGIIN